MLVLPDVAATCDIALSAVVASADVAGAGVDASQALRR